MTFGAYGLSLPGLPSIGHWLVPAPAHWPEWHVLRQHGASQPAEFVNQSRALLRLQPTGSAEIDRATATTVLTWPEPDNDAALLHPYLATTGIVAARWAGDHAFHGGAFVIDGFGWAVLAAREGGKSTTLAAMALLAGAGIVSDDVLVLSDGQLLAGPRCVDLRSEAAEALGQGELVDGAGARQRWRIRTASVPSAVPLTGVILPVWGESGSLRTVPVAERLPRMMEHLALRMLPPRLETLVEMAALPTLEFIRPRDLAQLQACSAMLAEECGRLSSSRRSTTAAGAG